MSSDSQDSEGEDLGTIRPTLIRELRNILDLYPDDGQILKELIQNAEDAGATVVKVLTDKRHFNQDIDERTLRKHPHLKFLKGPALCVYNNAEFSESDWKGIRMLHTSIKEDDPLKVGRFGLGFKSVFHLTDRLVIMSGDYIMYMDPFKGEDHYCNWRKVARRKGRELDSLLQSLRGAFGITEDTFQAGRGRFQGTLFWFPLRLGASELSSTLYRDQNVESLLASFKTEAPTLLLFLNRVQSVQVLARDDTHDPEVRFSVGIAPSCLKTVQKERERFVQAIASEGASIPQDEAFCTTEVVMETSDYETSQKSSDAWLVVNYHCGQRQMSRDLSQLCSAHNLCYRPYVGVAVPLTRHSDFQSQLFCFLPLPLDTRSPTGLPVHVHGYFALEQNRRHLKWPTADQLWNRASFDPASQWNCLLVTELLPVVYLQALMRLLELYHSAPEAFYAAWPIVSRVHDRWKPLLLPLYSSLVQRSIFFSCNLGKQWVYLRNSILQLFNPQFPDEVRHSVVKVYTASKQTLVELPQPVHATLKHMGFLQNIPVMRPSHVSQFIQYSLPQLGRPDKLNLLHYLASSEGACLLLKQPLLPLADGISFGTFGDRGKSPTFCCPCWLVQLFPGLEAKFCDVNIPEHVRNDLRCLAESGTLSLEELCESDPRIPMLLQKSLHVRFGEKSPVVNADDQWIERVWQFLASVSNLSVYSHITVLPVPLDGRRMSLLPLAGRYISSTAPGMESLSAALASALSKLGITVLHELPDYVTRHRGLMGKFINYPSVLGVLRAIQSVCDHQSLINSAVKTFNTTATSGDKAALVQFISSARNSSCALLSLFRQLNLFRTAFSNQSVSLNQVDQIGPSDLPPVSPPMSVLSCSPSESEAALLLGASDVSLPQIVKSIMELMCSRASSYPEPHVVQFMKYFLQKKSLVSVSYLLEMSRSIPFVRTESGKLEIPGNIYDPSSTLLQELFHSQRKIRFPTQEFTDPEMLKKLKKLGLKSENEVKPDDLIAAANAVSDMWHRNDTLPALQSAEALFNYLNKYSDSISAATLNAVSTVQCVPCLQDEGKPAHYPRSLPVRSCPQIVRPADMYSYQLVTVIGSAVPVCRSGSFADRCVHQEADSRDVLQHLKTVITLFQQQEVSEYKLILNEIFHYLARNISDPDVIQFLQSEKCILRESGESFARPSDFWIHRQNNDIDLRPYRFPLPVEMQQVKDLMEQCGTSESQSGQMLQTVLLEIRCKHLEHPGSHEDFDTDLQLVKQILEALRKSQAVTDGSTLLPVYEQADVLRFKPACECTIIPGMRHSHVPPDVDFEVHIVHPDVPINTAVDLGALQMMERALTGLEDLDFDYEQHEDLTTRLHALLEESYTDGFSVPKELIQNADDACASKVCFLLDERENLHCTTHLILEKTASLQGPAIWAYNDAMFSRSDFENIIRLGAGTKKEDTSKVGRFGLGFNAVYNLTDVPSFISGHILAMFDPQVRYLRKGAGLKLDFTKPVNKALLSTVPEQFEPFQNVFGCTLKGKQDVHYNGTLFRFPLRTAEQAVNNKLKSDSYSESKRRDFLKMLLEKAGSLLLFTQNVKEVEVFYIPSHCKDPSNKTCLLTVKKKCLATVVNQPQVRMNNKTVLQIMKENWSKQNANIKLQQKLETEMTVTAEASAVCGVGEGRSSVQWQVAWASGVGQSARLALVKKDEGLLPLAAAAISVSDNGLIPLRDNPRGFYNTGHLFCFLPLPENMHLSQNGLPVHVNGTFALTSDRRGLIVQTEDDLDSQGSSWNTALYSDAVSRAYLLLLQQVSKEAAMDSDFGRYFDLWPKTGVQCLVNSFYHCLQTDNNKVLPVPGHNMWVSFSEACFLQPHFRDSDCGRIAWNALQRFWNGSEYLVDVPSDICKLMVDKGLPGAFTAKVTSELSFYRDVFFPNLLSDWWIPEERDRLIHHAVMQDNQEINQLIKDHACIPCQGGKLLRKPSELVSPRGMVANLFLVSEQRFPQTLERGQTESDNSALSKTDFCSEKTLQCLSELGMITDELPWDLVLDRARSVGHLHAQKNFEESLKRASGLVEYLSVNIYTRLPSSFANCPGDIKRSLSQTAFLPVLRRPSDWPFPWAGDDAADHTALAPPADLCLENVKNLVACRKKVLDIKALRPDETLVSGKIRKVLKSMGVVVAEDHLNMNFLDRVLDQLLTVATQHNRNPNCKELSQSISSDIYAYLNSCLKTNEQNYALKKLFGQLTEPSEEKRVHKMLHSKLVDRCIVWTGNMFVQPSSVAFCCLFDCTPHLFRLVDSIQRYKHFFTTVGVKEQFSGSDVLLVLEKLSRENSGVKLPTEVIDLVSRLAQLLAPLVSHRHDSEVFDTGRVFLPDVDGFMHQACTLCVDDCDALQKAKGLKFVNEKIPKDTAKRLGAKSKKRQHLSVLTTPIQVKPFGQFEKLTTRIRRLLQGYTFDSSVCKELLQNADDAQATEAKFIMDFRSLPTSTVPENFESFQGPSLCFYNNKSFTTEDMKGIQNLGVGSKGQDDLKIGQFGVGFNAVFHVTDIPSFWTKVDDTDDVICVLDPNCQYIPDVEPSKPGVQFSNIEEVRQSYPDFFSGYLIEAVDTSQSGTLFRFPLRTDEMAKRSEIKKNGVTKTEIKELLDKFKDEASACLLFLNSLETVGFFTVSEDGTLKEEFEVRKTLDPASSLQLRSFKTSLQQTSHHLKQNSPSLKNIPVCQSAVLSKIVDSRGNGADWLIVHRVGFGKDVGLSANLEQEWGQENFRLLPRGGVAVKLKGETAKSEVQPSSQDKYQAFCMLPLPVFTGLPVHVNGHFALDHETRRNLWDGGGSRDDSRSEWNDVIASQVIVPAYIKALELVKDRLFPDNGKGFSKPLMTSALKQYHDLFPQPSGDSFWVKMVHDIYKTIAREELPLFPVICSETQEIEWMPAVKRHGFAGYFNNLVDIYVDEAEKQRKQQVYLTGGISASTDHRTRKPTPREVAKEMEDLLKRLNMKILEAPIHIHESFKASGVKEVQEVTADSVLVFLGSSGQDVGGGCNVGNLPRPVNDTAFQTVGNVRKIVQFVSKAKHFLSNLNGLPLCLRQSETLHVFSEAERPIISRYYYLLPGSAEEFLHECIISFFSDLRVTGRVLQSLSVSLFASRLNRTLTDPCFNSGKPCNLEASKLPSVPEFGKIWLAEVWKFLKEELNKLIQQNETPHGGIAYQEDIRDVRERAENMLSCLKRWCLIPVYKKEGRQEKQMLYPVEDVHQIIYVSSHDQTNPSFAEVLKSLPLPFLNTVHLSASDLLINLVASTNDPRALLRALTSCANTFSATYESRAAILNYFSKALEGLRKSCDDVRQIQRELRSLPVYPVIGSSGSGTVLCLTASVPEDGLRQWCVNRSHPVLLRANYIPKVLQKFLGFRCVTNEEFYSRYLLPTLELLPQEAILCHMKFLRDTVNGSTVAEDSDFAQQLKSASFICVNGTRHRAGEFFSPHQTVFKTMCSPDQFPPEPYCNQEWKRLMTLAGMVTEVTPALFLEFARAVECQGREAIIESVKEKSQILVRHLFSSKHLAQRELLSALKDVRFILPSTWHSTPEGQQLVKIAPPSPPRMISFSESTFERHLHLVWSSCWILAPYADPFQNPYSKGVPDIPNWLGLHQDPPKEKVIKHLENISLRLSGEEGHDIVTSLPQRGKVLEDIMEDIYKYLNKNISDSDIPYLKNLALVYKCDLEETCSNSGSDPSESGRQMLRPVNLVQMLKPVNVVIELQQQETIRGHIEKAPVVFGKYFKLFKKLGAEQSVTADHYAQFLHWQKSESREDPLHVEELKLVKTALEGLFHCLKEGSEEQKRISVSALYLPTEEKNLQKSTEIVFKDEAFVRRLQERPENVCFFLGFGKLEMTVSTPLDHIELLPRQYQMKRLSDIVKEIIPDTVLGRAAEEFWSRNLLERLEHPVTKEAIVRMVYSKHRNSDSPFTDETAEDVRSKLSNVFAKETAGLITLLMVHGREMLGSERHCLCFVDGNNGPPRQAFVYIDCENMETSGEVDACFHNLAIAVNYVLGENLDKAYLMEIFKKPVDGMKVLDNAGMEECDFSESSEKTVFPAPGTFVPLREHCHLDNSFYLFRPGEHVGYEVYDPELEHPEEGFTEEEGFGDAVYIYAIVLGEVCINGEEHVPLFARRYRIYLGGDRGEAEVSATELYKFFRRHTESTSTDIVQHTGEQTPAEESHSSLDMRTVLREIKEILSKAWQQFSEEKDRRRVLKRLLLKWHPDKNHGREDFCTRVTQKILYYVDLLDEGKTLPDDSEDEDHQGNVPSPRPGSMFNSSFYANMNRRAHTQRAYYDSEDHQGNVPSPRPGSMFNSSFHANMNRRARTQRAYYDSERGFGASQSTHGAHSHSDGDWYSSSSRHEEARRCPNPQPVEAWRWFKQAKADFTAASAATGVCDKGHNWICYQCHQAVEKAMKAVIYYRDADTVFMMSHDLPSLAGTVNDPDITSIAQSLESRLGPHTRMRYPDVHMYPRGPADVYTEEDAGWACDMAMKVLQRVQCLIQM